ncbi:MAG: hypothetical protein QXK71_00385 [Pyrobaculum sp.]
MYVIIRIGDREEYIASVEDLERLCRQLREELQKECQFHSWYIRISPERLFALLKKAYIKYTQGVLNTGEIILEFLDDNKLSKSLVRTITPTLSSLGLTASGKFTAAAVEIGRLIYENRLEDVKAKLRQLVYRNCILKEILESSRDCDDIEKTVASVLTAYGKSIRLDELKYTTELLKILKCEDCDFKCMSVDRLSRCLDRVVKLTLDHVRDLFERLDITLLPEHLEYSKVDKTTYLLNVKGTAKTIGHVLISEAVETADLQLLKNILTKLDVEIREGQYEVYIKIVPILEGNGCKTTKLLIEVVRGDLEKVSKIVKISS